MAHKGANFCFRAGTDACGADCGKQKSRPPSLQGWAEQPFLHANQWRPRCLPFGPVDFVQTAAELTQRVDHTLHGLSRTLQAAV